MEINSKDTFRTLSITLPFLKNTLLTLATFSTRIPRNPFCDSIFAQFNTPSSSYHHQTSFASHSAGRQ